METTRAFFSLRWKILAWFFVNLLVLGGILFGFLRVQFRVGIGSLLAGPTSDRLFDPFFRPEAARTRETGGTGLGLAIVKSCVEACGGQVAVQTRQPSGLSLTFTLPRAK